MWARGMWGFGMWGAFWGPEDSGNTGAGGDWELVGRHSRRRRRRTLIPS
mgnify:CR=1 FL=1